MKRSNTLGELHYGNFASHKQRVAYHEAGHAAGIHLNNRLKNLPPVAFKIILEGLGDASNTDGSIAKVKGGRLIQPLPRTSNGNGLEPSDAMIFRFIDGFHPAFEADVVNLLIGPLAEAKYIALLDDEPFHPQLFSAQSLKYYGGDADLEAVNDYLAHHSTDAQVQAEGLAHFLRLAFDFVDDKANWKAITRLAQHILDSQAHEICGKTVAAILDQRNESPAVASSTAGQAFLNG